MSQVKLTNISKSYGATDIIKNISLDVKDGEFVVFVGPSGCGKSTLLRLIAGLTEVSAGEVFIGNAMVNDVSPAERKIAMVFQSYALYPHMTVAENMGFSLKMAKESKESIDNKVMKAAQILQLDKLLERKPKELSGGQRQRVAIGRAIVREPEVFLFDEPLSNLDAELRVDMRVQIAKIHQRLQSTMIYVTHDQVEAMTMADKIVVLRDGYLQQLGSPLELYHYPANIFVAGFIGSPKMNFAEVSYVKGDAKSVEIACNGKNIKLPIAAKFQRSVQKEEDYSGASDVVLGFRPKYISVGRSSGGISFDGEIEVVERLGGLTYAYVKSNISKDNIVVEISEDAALDVGHKVNLSIQPEDCYLFTSQGEALQRLTKFKTYQ